MIKVLLPLLGRSLATPAAAIDYLVIRSDDVRRLPRSDGACDSGAFEQQAQ